MRVIVQRARSAHVDIAGVEVGRIGPGLVVLVGFTHGDTSDVVEWMADKITGLRLFADEAGKMNLDLLAVGGALLVVSQFTLYGDASKGRRPSFVDAARPEEAIPLYQHLLSTLRARGVTLSTGEFGADMQLTLTNDGPVTISLERHAG